MKLISTFAGVALCAFGKNKEKTENARNINRLGKDPVVGKICFSRNIYEVFNCYNSFLI